MYFSAVLCFVGRAGNVGQREMMVADGGLVTSLKHTIVDLNGECLALGECALHFGAFSKEFLHICTHTCLRFCCISRPAIQRRS